MPEQALGQPIEHPIVVWPVAGSDGKASIRRRSAGPESWLSAPLSMPDWPTSPAPPTRAPRAMGSSGLPGGTPRQSRRWARIVGRGRDEEVVGPEAADAGPRIRLMPIAAPPRPHRPATRRSATASGRPRRKAVSRWLPRTATPPQDTTLCHPRNPEQLPQPPCAITIVNSGRIVRIHGHHSRRYQFRARRSGLRPRTWLNG